VTSLRSRSARNGTNKEGEDDSGGDRGQDQAPPPRHEVPWRSAEASDRRLHRSWARPEPLGPGAPAGGGVMARRPGAPASRAALPGSGRIGRRPWPLTPKGAGELGGVQPGEPQEADRGEDGQGSVAGQGKVVEQHAKPEVGRADADRPGGRVPPGPVRGQLRPPVDQAQRRVGCRRLPGCSEPSAQGGHGQWNPARSSGRVALAGMVTVQLAAARAVLARVWRWTSWPP